MGVTRRIGMFGGTFDPPHNAHVLLARTAIRELDLDRLHVVPARSAWYKSRALGAAEQRLALCQLAFADVPATRVDARELQRDGVTYTVDTLRELRAENPAAALFLLIGSDQAAAFHGWHLAAEILRLAHIAIAVRGDAPDDLDPRDPLPGLQVDPARLHRLRMRPIALSATLLRQRLAAGKSVAKSVPAAVAAYIESHHLYQTA